jgi:phage terminase small subunit
MAKRGRKPQPTEVKKLKGETRPSRLPEKVIEFPVSEKVPPAPSWLKSKDGRELWNELAGQLFAQRIMADVDRHALAHLCQLHGEIVSGYRRKVSPTAAELSQLRMYFSEFGVTPSSRQKVGTGNGGKSQNPFQRNRRPTPGVE